MNGFCIAVLRVLNEKHHQKCDDGRAGINDELPGIGKMKHRAGYSPDNDNDDRDRERPGSAQNGGRLAREDAKGIAHRAKKVSLRFLRL